MHRKNTKKNSLCRRVGRRHYADLSHAALDILRQCMSLCWIIAIFEKKRKKWGSGFWNFLNTQFLMVARSTWVCPDVLNWSFCWKLESRTTWMCVLSQTLHKRGRKRRESHLKSQRWRHGASTQHTRQTSSPSAPLQTNTTTGHNMQL